MIEEAEYTLLLGRNGIIYNEKKEVKQNEIVHFLNDDNFELEHGFSLRSYFKILKRYPLFTKNNSHISNFVDEFDKSPIIGCINKDIANYILLFQPRILVSNRNNELLDR